MQTGSGLAAQEGGGLPVGQTSRYEYLVTYLTSLCYHAGIGPTMQWWIKWIAANFFVHEDQLWRWSRPVHLVVATRRSCGVCTRNWGIEAKQKPSVACRRGFGGPVLQVACSNGCGAASNAKSVAYGCQRRLVSQRRQIVSLSLLCDNRTQDFWGDFLLYFWI